MSGGIYLVLDAAFSAVAAKFERDVVLAKVRDLEAKGTTPDQIVVAIRAMRNDAIGKAQSDINAS